VPKQPRTVRLSTVLWLQVDDLKGYYGDGPNDVVSHILTDWLSEKRREIEAHKTHIDSLRQGNPLEPSNGEEPEDENP